MTNFINGAIYQFKDILVECLDSNGDQPEFLAKILFMPESFGIEEFESVVFLQKKYYKKIDENIFFAWVLDQDEEQAVSVFQISSVQYEEIMKTDPCKKTINANGYSFNTHLSGRLGLYRNTVHCKSIEEVISFKKTFKNIVYFPDFLPGDYIIENND
jgi:hypothetical protein